MLKKFFEKLLLSLHLGGKDWIVLLLALALSFSIWLIHSLSGTYSGVMTVPVEAESKIEGRAGVSTIQSVAVARVRTTGLNLVLASGRERRKPVRVKVDPQDLRHATGDDFILIGAARSNYVRAIFGDGAVLETFLSDTLRFRFPKENHRKVPVILVSDISYKEQFMASSPVRTVPDSVIIYGEKSVIDPIDGIRTMPLSLQNVRHDVHGTVKLSRPDGVRLSDDDVAYSIAVSRFVEILSTVPVSMRSAPSERTFDIRPPVAQIVLRCAFPLKGDPSERVSVFVDFDDFEKSVTGRCVPKVAGISTGVIDYRISPEVFDCIEVGK